MKNKKRYKSICICVPAWNGGGVEKIISKLIKYIYKNGCYKNIYLIISTRPNDLNKMNLKNIEHYCKIIIFYNKKPILSLINYFYLFKKYNYDYVISNTYPINIITILMKLLFNNFKLIICEHITLDYQLNNSKYYYSKFIYRYFIKLLYPFSNGIIAVSNGVKDNILKITQNKKLNIKILYNPVYSKRDFFNISNLKLLSIIQKKFVFIAVGSLIYQKGFDLLIEAFNILVNVLKENKSILYIVGQGPLKSELETKIERYKLENYIILVGFKNDIYNWIYTSDVFILSSRWEGMPTVLVEAMALGKPVLSTDCKSGPNELIQNNRTGILINTYNNVSEMAKKMFFLRKNKKFRKILAKNARKSVLKFSENIACNEYIKMISEK